MVSSIDAVYLVEASPFLRDQQKQLLCGDAPMTETSIGHQSTSKYTNIPLIWTENIRFVPSGKPASQRARTTSHLIQSRSQQDSFYSSPRVLRRPSHSRIPVNRSIGFRPNHHSNPNSLSRTLPRNSKKVPI